MTEPQVASSDATNIEASIKKEDNEYIINGKKWWTSGAMDPRCKVLIFMGKTDPNNPDKHKQQSQIVVPMDTPGIKGKDICQFSVLQMLHMDMQKYLLLILKFKKNLLLGEGRGFEIARED